MRFFTVKRSRLSDLRQEEDVRGDAIETMWEENGNKIQKILGEMPKKKGHGRGEMIEGKAAKKGEGT